MESRCLGDIRAHDDLHAFFASEILALCALQSVFLFPLNTQARRSQRACLRADIIVACFMRWELATGGGMEKRYDTTERDAGCALLIRGGTMAWRVGRGEESAAPGGRGYLYEGGALFYARVGALKLCSNGNLSRLVFCSAPSASRGTLMHYKCAVDLRAMIAPRPEIGVLMDISRTSCILTMLDPLHTASSKRN